MQKGPSGEADSPSPTQEIPRILRNPINHYSVHMSSPLVPIQSHINPVYALPQNFFRIHFNIILPSTSSSYKWLFRSGFPTKTLYDFLSSIRATCLVHLILLDLITRIIFGEANRSWSSPLCNLLKFPVTSSLLSPDISPTPSALALSFT
jgi:hypothetical protein